MLNYLKKVLYILGSSKKKLPFLLLVFITTSIVEVFGIGILGPFFAIVSDPTLIQKNSVLRAVSSKLNISTDKNFIIFLSASIGILFILKSALYFFSKFYILEFSHSHRGKMVETLNRAYLEGDYSSFASKNSSTLIKNIVNETQSFCSLILQSILYGISNFVILIFLIALMFASDFLLLTAVLGSLLPVVLLVYLLKNKLRRWGQTQSNATQRMIQTLNQGLGGFKETRIIGSAPYFEDQMAQHTKAYARASSLAESFDMMPRILIETSLVVFIVFFIGAAQIFQFRSTDSLIANLGIFAVASIRLLPAASQIISAIGNLQKTRHVVDILYKDLKAVNQDRLLIEDTASSRGQNPNFSIDALKFSDVIQLSNIIYRYSEESEPAISAVSLEIKKGTSVAFIGQSGAGKTTLVDIILGLLIPQSGDITVDGVSIYSNLRTWQNLVGYIPQSIFLLDDTVERNIAFGVPDHLINYEKLESAVAAAQLQELITRLPNGMHTRVGERGVMLSGGQRQRIGIARALYHEREILVLDEATSALDNETERRVSEAINQLSGKKTLIMIAHRLSTVKNCDQVYMLEKGRIIKSGSYCEVVC